MPRATIEVQASQPQPHVWIHEGNCISTSFDCALAIVSNRKLFQEREYADAFIIDVTNELFDDFSDKDKLTKQIKCMPLSARTVHDCYHHYVKSN